jgi:hypothetical protein
MAKRDAASMSNDEDAETKSTAEDFTPRDHLIGTATKTLYSAELGMRRGCFLCTYTSSCPKAPSSSRATRAPSNR